MSSAIRVTATSKRFGIITCKIASSLLDIRQRGREFGERKISKYDIGDEILVYAKDEGNKYSGLVG